MICAEEIVFKRRGRTVLNGVSLTLQRGEVVALIGANGAGKTTLLRIIAGQLSPQRGRVSRDCPLSHIALLADKPALYPDWSVAEALQRIAGLYAVPKSQVAALVEEFALTDVLLQPAKGLSHGYRQRLAMAQMLLAQPEVMLFDEPSNGLDYRQKRALWPLLRHLTSRGGVLLISHDWAEVAAVADRVYWLADGRCYVVALPPRVAGGRWLGFANAEAAQQACPQARVRDGRFVAVDSGMRYDAAQVLTISDGYPAQALQEKIDALA